MPLERGTTLGPYQIESPLGAGGMGEVYKATDARLERTVAIKVLPAHVASDPERKARFEREAKTISSLNHPHICTLHDVGREGDVDFLVMEYLEGETLALDPGPYTSVSLAPDGERLAFGYSNDVWTYDVARDLLARVTVDDTLDADPVWTPSGQRIVYRSERASGGLWIKSADGAGRAEQVLPMVAQPPIPTEVAPDGTYVLFEQQNRDPSWDILMVALDDDARSPRSLLATEFQEAEGRVFPNGRYLAYQSDRSGQWEIYVRPFPNVETDRRQISTAGGTSPTWSSNSAELFYRDASTIVAVPVTFEPEFQPGPPEVLFEDRYLTNGRGFDVAPDGERFLLFKEAASTEDSISGHINVILNWTEELESLVPTP